MTRVFSAIVILLIGTAPLCAETVALFDSSTDTIQVNGQTLLGTAATYEARVLLTPEHNGTGVVFNELGYGLEDKQFTLSTNGVAGYSYYLNTDNLVGTPVTGTLIDGVWHHIAYVYDGVEERIYIDGQKRAARSASGTIRNSSASLPHIGANYREREGLADGFQGYPDTLRISDVARYSGDSFTPPSGKLSSDANTQLLYNFDEMPGSATIVDVSGRGLNGTLGVGFTGATSPEFVANPVPEPSTFVLLSIGTIGLVGYAWRRRFSA